MEYRILGPLAVMRDGVELPLRGRHLPRLLAALLLDAGRSVTVSRLVDVLWEDEPPRTARRQVQNHLAALRRLLGPDAIVALGDGYLFEVEDTWLDSRRFEALTTRARSQVRAGRLMAAVADFDAAVALWRGDVLAGMTGRCFEPAVVGWRERWLGVVEERAEARLSVGRHAEVAAELPELLLRWPFRQRLASHLMLALYRCGRAVEAAEVYTRLRERLAEELGVDPNPLLRDRYDKIRRADPVLDGAELGLPDAEPGGVGVVPAQLPADIATFTGRVAELARLDRLSDAAGSVGVLSTVDGVGGVGKTALAVHWGRRRRDWFPDGQLYLDLRGFDADEPLRPVEALSRLLRALGVPGEQIPTEPGEAAELYRSTMRGRRILTILDNARDAEQVRPLLSGTGATVITSRGRMAGLAETDGTLVVGLEPLHPKESIELLTELLGLDRVRAEPEATRRLAELCGHLPLALRIAAANLLARHDTDVGDYVAALDGAGRLERLSIDGDPKAAVAATFELSVTALAADARELFLRLGLVPGDEIPEGLAVDISGHDGDRALELLRGLVSAHLLEAHATGRYRFHDLVRLFARQRALAELTAATREAVEDRVIEWHYENRRRFGADDIANVISMCAGLGEHPRLWRAAMPLGYAADLGTGQQASHDCCQRALRIAELHGDVLGQARMLAVLGALTYAIGEPPLSLELTRRSVAVGRAHLDRATVGELCVGLGVRLIRNGELLEAERWLLESLSVVGAPGTESRVLVRSLNLANVYRPLGRYADAEKYLDQAASLASDGQSVFPFLGTLVCRATMRNDQGLFGQAWEHAGEALALAEGKRSHRQQVFALQQLGRAEAGMGNFVRARSLFKRSGEVSRRHNLLNPEKQAHLMLAELAVEQGDYVEARGHMSRMTATAAGRPAPPELAEDVRVNARILVGTGEYAAARQLATEAVRRFEAMPFPLRQAESLLILAEAHTGLGHHTQAERCRRQSHTVFRRLGVPEPGTSSDARPR